MNRSETFKGIAVFLLLSLIVNPGLVLADVPLMSSGSLQAKPQEEKTPEGNKLVSTEPLKAAPSPSEGHSYGDDGMTLTPITPLDTKSEPKEEVRIKNSVVPAGILVKTNALEKLNAGPLSPSEGHPYGDDGMVFKEEADKVPYGDDALVIPKMLQPVRNDAPVRVEQKEISAPSSQTSLKTLPPADLPQKYDDGGMVFPVVSPIPVVDRVVSDESVKEDIPAVANLKRQILEIKTSRDVQIAKVEEQLKKDLARIEERALEINKQMKVLDVKIAENEVLVRAIDEKLRNPDLSKKDSLRLSSERNRLENQRKEYLKQKQAHEKRRLELEANKKQLAQKAQDRIKSIRKDSDTRIAKINERIAALLKKLA